MRKKAAKKTIRKTTTTAAKKKAARRGAGRPRKHASHASLAELNEARAKKKKKDISYIEKQRERGFVLVSVYVPPKYREDLINTARKYRESTNPRMRKRA